MSRSQPDAQSVSQSARTIARTGPDPAAAPCPTTTTTHSEFLGSGGSVLSGCTARRGS